MPAASGPESSSTWSSAITTRRSRFVPRQAQWSWAVRQQSAFGCPRLLHPPSRTRLFTPKLTVVNLHGCILLKYEAVLCVDALSAAGAPRMTRTGEPRGIEPPGSPQTGANAEIRSHLSLDNVHSTVEVPHHRAGFWEHWRAFVGPAILVSVGYMDPGNWGTDLQAG